MNFNTKTIIAGVFLIAGLGLAGAWGYKNQYGHEKIVQGELTQNKMGKLNLVRFETKNGAKVIFVESKVLPMVDIEVLVNAGSARDEQKPGLAMLTASLLDQGADKKNADDIANGFEEYGAIFSQDVNLDFASFHLRSLSDSSKLSSVVELMSLVLNKASFPQEAFERHQKNQLIGIDYEKQLPAKVAGKAIMESIYPNHPYNTKTNGTTESIANITLQDIIAFYQKYYGAKNVTIAIVGDIDKNKALEIADALTSNMRVVEKAGELPSIDLTKQVAKNQKINFPSEQTHVLMAQPYVEVNSEDYYALTLANHILVSQPLVSRLFTNIREKEGLVYNVYGRFSPMLVQGPYIFGLQTRTEQAAKAKDLLIKEIQTFIDKGPSEDELKSAKANLIGSFPMVLSTNDSICSNIASMAFYNKDPNFFESYEEKMNAVSINQINAAIKKHMMIDKMSVVEVGK